MKGRLIFKTKKNEIITADINVDMRNTEGIYQDGSTHILGLEFIGLQWIPDAKFSIDASITELTIFHQTAKRLRRRLKKTVKASEGMSL